uniref:Candidate secreted effector n=1 Tax=Meloidogyne incognita TaxID=6306 RepID=A0A914LBW8_MELIC
MKLSGNLFFRFVVKWAPMKLGNFCPKGAGLCNMGSYTKIRRLSSNSNRIQPIPLSGTALAGLAASSFSKGGKRRCEKTSNKLESFLSYILCSFLFLKIVDRV